MSFGTWVWWTKVGIAGAAGEFCLLNLLDIFLWVYLENTALFDSRMSVLAGSLK